MSLEIYLPEMLDKVKSYGIDAVEMTAGWLGSCPHINRLELLSDPAKITAFKAELEKRGMRISALNCSGNPLSPGKMGEDHTKNTYETVELAGKLGVKKIVMMSGCRLVPLETRPRTGSLRLSPGLTTWPRPCSISGKKFAIPWWKKFVAHCQAHGVEQVAIEEFPCMLVYNPETLWKLRNAVGPVVGINLDPSHLMTMGADPIASARALKGAIYHIHGKDARIERGLSGVNGLLETKPVTDCENRTWNYVAVGCGKDLQWWKEFFSVAHMVGYDGDVSLEMEDLTMTVEAGVQTSIDALKQTISQ